MGRTNIRMLGQTITEPNDMYPNKKTMYQCKLYQTMLKSY